MGFYNNDSFYSGNAYAIQQDVADNTAQLAEITNNGTAKPVVPLLKATYDGNKAFYDAQDVIWAIHETAIV